MNFRTTLVLIVLLAAAAVAVFFTRQRAAKNEDQVAESPKAAKVLDVTSASVTKLAITPANDKPITLERSGVDWRMLEPVNAPADPAAVATLVDTLANLQSRGDVEASAAASSGTGLDQPHFNVQITTIDGKTTSLDVGDRTATGGGLYVQRQGEKTAQVVDAALFDQLDKPASDFRRKKLFDVASPMVQQLEIRQSNAPQTVLQKHGNDWRMTSPQDMPADEGEVSDLVAAVASLQASTFVSETVDDPRRRRLDEPQLVVAFSTTQPTTQASTQSTSQPTTAGAMTSVKFGGFTDVTKESVFAVASNAPTLFTVSASTVDRLKKKPLELRDKRAVTIDPEQVSKVLIVHDRAATTRPTTQPAAHDQTSIERNTQVRAATAPATAPATMPASTRPASISPASAVAPASAPTTRLASTAPSSGPSTSPSTGPAEPPSKWVVVASTAEPSAGEPSPADDRRMESLLAMLHPLRAVRYLESSPATQPVEKYTLTIDTLAAGGASSGKYVITLVDPGNGQPVVADYNGLTFEVSRTLLDAVKADLRKSAKSSPSTPDDSDESTPFPTSPRPEVGPDRRSDR